MDWPSILIGFALGLVGGLIVWWITTKFFTAKLSVSSQVERTGDALGNPRYRFTLANKSHRDAVDVIVKCTMFSQGWANGPTGEIATIDLPVSVGQIDVMPARQYFSSRGRRLLDLVGDRIITLELRNISSFQKAKLDAACRQRIDSGEVTLEELLDLGKNSFVNVVVYGFDRFSGSRSVYAERYYQRADIVDVEMYTV
jgi:hypothetical protein